jgi:MSHA biogenesis protein MshI
MMVQRLSFLFKDKHESSPYHCCIDINRNELLLSYGRHQSGDKIELQGCITLNYSNNHFLDSLTSWVNEHNFQGASCTWILRPSYYQLLLMDILPVPDEEMRSAIYWKIQPLLPFPIEDAVYDYFLLPEAKTIDMPNLMIVVASSASYLAPICQMISQSGLKLVKIDIPELVLKTIGELYESKENSSSVIYLQDNTTYFVITRNKLLFMNRHLEFNFDTFSLNEMNIEDRIDKLALEIQRSFDYFQARFRLPIPTNSFIASTYASSIDIANLLMQRLTVPIHVLNLSGYLMTKQHFPIEKQGKYLSVLSQFMTQKIENYATAD